MDGGPTPIGYVVKEKKLIIDPKDAETVRHIYAQYAEHGSVRNLKEHLDLIGLLTKHRIRKDGTSSGGKLFGRGHLQWILSNPIYAGWMTHKGRISEGQHEAVIARDIWHATQLLMTNNAPRERKRPSGDFKNINQAIIEDRKTTLLSGMVYDETGVRVTASHANKAGVRYRYYVSRPHLNGESKTASVGSVSRVPAAEIENAVVKSINEYLVARKEKPVSSIAEPIDRQTLLDQITRIDVYAGRIAVQLKSDDADERSESSENHSISIPWQKPL